MKHTTMLYAQLMQRQEEIKTQLQLVFPPITTERFSEKTGKKLKDSVVEFNPGSRQQIADRLMSLGWKPTEKTEGGGWKVDETVLSGVDIPEAKLVAEYLMLVKRTSQIQSWIDAVKDDGRIHGKVITNGAVTGRMTHSSPNMAQVPASGSPYGKECRACFTVPKGKKLVGCDASGLELRMLAHYMQDTAYTEFVVNGKREDGTDIHTVNQKSAGLPTRDNAKTFIYAFLYGAGDAKIGSIVGGSAADGKKLKNRFLRQTPALKKLIEKVQKIGACGSLPGLDGRRVWIRSDHAALNTLLQSAGAIVMKQALIHLQEKLEYAKIDALFVGNIHDELQIEVCADKAEEVGILAKQAIIDAGSTLGLRCPLDGDYSIGNSWAETH
jgi:DNA polymerase I-like protein with 3'-5' exonuclease and polymerase domains